MKTTITFRQIGSSEPLKKYAMERLKRLDRYQTRATEAHVILSMERYLEVAEVILSWKRFRAMGKVSSNDMYASIDGAVEKVEKTLKRHHDKRVKSKSAILPEEAVPTG